MYPWAHVYSSFKGQWLPGDHRGFYSRKHRIHSTKHENFANPDVLEHKALEEHAQVLSKKKIWLNTFLRPRVMEAVRDKFFKMDLRVAAIACQATHLHALVKIGNNDSKRAFGRAKQRASHAVGDVLGGSIWGGSSGVERVGSIDQFVWTFWYITNHACQGAAVWCDEE